MEMILCLLCVPLAAALLFCLLRIYLMRRGIEEISGQFYEKITTDTNTLIHISSRDPSVRRLAAELNGQLRLFHQERRRFHQGDQQLKEAITNISHDLRTPLTAVCGYLELLKREPQSSRALQYLDMMENRAEAMKQLTEELFRYSVLVTAEAGAPEPVVLTTFLEETLAAHYGGFKERGITPCISLPDTPIERVLVPSSLTRILENIISNALKYSGGDFFVSMDKNGEMIFSNFSPDLTPVTAGRLFDRFYTVETGRNSTGLGLSIARLLTEQMGGSIDADYRDGRLSITLYFPACAVQPSS